VKAKGGVEARVNRPIVEKRERIQKQSEGCGKSGRELMPHFI
jgi:hypothetical protein